jgi:DNA-binding FrmR family transcriptional regulator
VRTTESQLEACRRVAERLGFDVIHEFVDECISGATSTNERWFRAFDRTIDLG